MARGARRVSPDYDKDVFINCPFDSKYEPLFRALIFAVFACGLRPRCALEAYDSGVVRIEKIVRIIYDCRWGVHDISRTSLNANRLPRFNMPFELGLFLGAQRYGADEQTRKSCLILDTKKYRYQAFISDIAGQDIEAHNNRAGDAIAAVRSWLAASRSIAAPPGALSIQRRYARFSHALPAICAALDKTVDELAFAEFTDIVSTWLQRDLASRG